VETINATHGDIVTQMDAERPSISELDSHGTQECFRPLVVKFDRDSEVMRYGSKSSSVEFFTQADSGLNREDRWIRESVECAISNSSGRHCASGHYGC